MRSIILCSTLSCIALAIRRFVKEQLGGPTKEAFTTLESSYKVRSTATASDHAPIHSQWSVVLIGRDPANKSHVHAMVE